MVRSQKSVGKWLMQKDEANAGRPTSNLKGSVRDNRIVARFSSAGYGRFAIHEISLGGRSGSMIKSISFYACLYCSTAPAVVRMEEERPSTGAN